MASRRRILECTLVLVILAAPGFSAGNDARVGGEDTSAQHCLPEDDVPGAPTIYCRA